MTEIILTSSVLILLLAVLRRVMRGRISPCAQYALWLLAAARLLIPGTLFTAPVSVLGAAEQLQTSILLAELAETPAGGLPAEASGLPTDGPSAPFVTQPEDGPSAVFTMKPPVFHAEELLDRVWKTGIVITGGAMAVSNLVFCLRLRKSRKRLNLPASPWAGKLPVYEAEGLPSPCLFGLLRPAIYFNEAAMGAAHPEHILAHEHAHYRHGDHLWSILRSICLVIHWYNPLVWWAAALSRRDCELACDASALRRLGEGERIDYGQTLLSMVSNRTSPAALLRTATTMTAGKRAMTERIALIVRQPKARKITLALAAVLACVLAACTFGGGSGGNGGLSQTLDPALLEFPGLHWNDSPEAVMEALGVTEEDFFESGEDDYDNLRSWWFVLADYPFGGQTAQHAIFCFMQYAGSDSELGLNEIRLDYPNDIDFSVVREYLQQQYGTGSETMHEHYEIAVDSGTLRTLSGSGPSGVPEQSLRTLYGDELMDLRAAVLEQPGPHRWYWRSDNSALPDSFVEQAANFLVKSRTRQTEPLQRVMQPPTLDTAEEYVRLQPITYLWWTDAAPTSFFRPSTTVNQVQWVANEYVGLLQSSSVSRAE